MPKPLEEHTDLTIEPEHDGSMAGRFFAFLRINALTGLVVLAPVLITVWLLKLLIISTDNFLQGFIPEPYHLNNLVDQYFHTQLPFDFHGLGLLAGALLLILVGMLARNLFGRKLVNLGEALLNRIPGVRSVYVSVKQVIETLATSNSKSFREVVMVEYPRKGIWALGFVSGTTKGQVQKLEDEELVNVFLPTTPNPTSGFLLFIPRKDLVTLDMSIEQGIKMVISAGIVTPTIAEGRQALARQRKQARSKGKEDAAQTAATEDPAA